MKKSGFVLIGAITMSLLLNCESSQKEYLHNIGQLNSPGGHFPEPSFDKDLENILNEYKKRYDAKGVRIGRPFMYSSTGDSSYWLKVELLNPNLGDKDFKDFGKEVALYTLDRLINDQDFEKIEVSVTNKRGFILTFSSQQNAYYYTDSLKMKLTHPSIP